MRRTILLPLFALLALVAAPGALPAADWQGASAVGLEVNGPKGRPLPGARVTLSYRGGGGGGPAAVLTDGRGRAAFTSLAPGSWNLEVSHPGHLTYVAALTVRQGKKAEATASFLQATGEGREALRVKFYKASSPAGDPAPVAPQPPATPEAPAAQAPPPAPTQPPPVAQPTARPSAPEPAPAPAEPAPEPQPEAPRPIEAPPAPAAEPQAASTPQDQPEAAPVPSPATPEPAPPASPPASPATTPPAPAQEQPEPVEAPAPKPEAPPEPASPPAPEPSPPAPPVPEPTPAEPESPQPEAPSVAPEPAPMPSAPPPAAPATEPESEPEAPTPAPDPQPAEDAPPSPESRPVAAAPPAPAAPPQPALPLRSFSNRSCPECKPGEWAAAAQLTVVASGNGCRAGLVDELRGALQALADGPGLERFAGQAVGPVQPTALEILPEATRAQTVDRLSELGLTGEGCGLAAVALPRGARFVGFRFQGGSGDPAGDCLAGADCPAAGASWPAAPTIVRGRFSTVIAAVYENRTGEEPRTARLIAYFEPPAGDWPAEP